MMEKGGVGRNDCEGERGGVRSRQSGAGYISRERGRDQEGGGRREDCMCPTGLTLLCHYAC